MKDHTFKVGDKVRHKYRDEGSLTVMGLGEVPGMILCSSDDNSGFGVTL